MIPVSHTITPLIREIFKESPDKTLPKIIGDWDSKGLISKSNPVHFIFNIASLCLLPAIALPMVEAITDVRILNDKVFQEKRIQSISYLLKKGMLK